MQGLHLLLLSQRHCIQMLLVMMQLGLSIEQLIAFRRNLLQPQSELSDFALKT